MIEEYLQSLGFKENDWGFLSNTIDGVEFILMNDALSGYTLSYSYISNRTVGNNEIPLGRKPSLDDLKKSMEKVQTIFVKVKLINDDEYISGTVHLQTTNRKFIEELKKFICPFRLSNYLTQEENKSYTSFFEPLSHNEYALSIDLSSTTEKILDKKVEAGELLSIIPELYIKTTPHLDRYGNQIIHDEIFIIEHLYGQEQHESKQSILFNDKTYCGWFIEGYDTIEELKKVFSSDSEIEKLYYMDFPK